MTETPHEAGKSSFDLIDAEKFFDALQLAGVKLILDLGCGEGRYAIPLAKRVEPGAKVRGFDLWASGVQLLKEKVVSGELTNVEAEICNLEFLPSVGDAMADLALIATVVHDLEERRQAKAALREAARVLKQGGRLAVVEFKKLDTKPGPPINIRLSPEELDHIVEPAGFARAELVDLGPCCYLAIYNRLG